MVTLLSEYINFSLKTLIEVCDNMLHKLNRIAELIGQTPIVKLEKVVPSHVASVFMKLEYMNPGGSHKDRIACYMLRQAIMKGVLKEGDCIIEVSSGNTALSLAWMSARLGLRAYFIVEENISEAKIAMLEILGAEVIKVKLENFEGEDPRLVKAKELEDKLGGVFIHQSSNEANFRAHYETTAREIVDQMNRNVHAFVMGIGTGGTIIGVGKYFKEVFGNDFPVVGVVPNGASLLYGKPVGKDEIEGLAKHTVPDIYTNYRNYIDKIVELSAKESADMVKRLAREEGFFIGPSTGAAVTIAKNIAAELEPEKNVITVAADSLFRYPLNF